MSEYKRDSPPSRCHWPYLAGRKPIAMDLPCSLYSSRTGFVRTMPSMPRLRRLTVVRFQRALSCNSNALPAIILQAFLGDVGVFSSVDCWAALCHTL